MSVTSNMHFLLKRRGRTATFRKTTGSGYDPSTGKNTETTQDYTVKAYFAEYNLGEKNSSEVATGSRWVSISTVDSSGNTIPKPTTQDRIIGAEDSLVVVNVQTIYNGEFAVCYLCTVSE